MIPGSLQGRWLDDMVIRFTDEEVITVIREFVRTVYSLDDKDIAYLSLVDGNGKVISSSSISVHVGVKTKQARPESWTYRTLKDDEK